MIKKALKQALRGMGYEIHRVSRQPVLPAAVAARGAPPSVTPPPIDPVWPLPRQGEDLSDDEIRRRVAAFELWHYAYQFEGGLSFSARHHNAPAEADEPRRPLQRFRHFIPDLVAANGGSLEGKRVLDIACNSGFWSLQCALLGANVVGFDAREELVAQANLLKSIVGVTNVEYRQLDFWDMTPAALDGKFDVVLNLGLLYHLAKPLEALELTLAMSHGHVVLDTGVFCSEMPLSWMFWELPDDIRNAAETGVVVYPSPVSVDMMLAHLGAKRWHRIPVRSQDMPRVYHEGRRASWLIEA